MKHVLSSFGLLLFALSPAATAADDEVSVSEVRASSEQDGNPAWHAFDGDPSTRWAAEGAGQELRVLWKASVRVEEIGLHFFKGEERQYRFRLLITRDGKEWQEVFAGESALGDVFPVRFESALIVGIELVCDGNSANAWNSIHEIDVAGVDRARAPAKATIETPLTLRVPEEWQAAWFAIEPQVASPVALSVANDGTVYVTRTSRRKRANLDIRNNRDWLNTQLAFKTVADKEAFYRRVLTAEASEKNEKRVIDHNGDGVHDWRDLMVPTEQILRLVDEDGDGRADTSNVFAEEFRTLVTGVAGGVLAHRGDVYATVSPDLWKMTDRDGDGVAEHRESLAHGFSVHVAFAGHNMHGLTAGPDGRIYWSIGDIGAAPVDREGQRHDVPDEGAVFRCWPDGSGFEVYAKGLRNPQELAFDDHGYLFTGENDSDYGDRERWLYLVEGGEYGWRNYWQYQSGDWGAPTGDYRLWMEERLWEPDFPEQAAYIVPPLANIGPGPCGLSYYPGTGLSEKYENNFFLALFTGSRVNSRIDRFRLAPDGAGFRIEETEPVITNLLATGVDFGPDGALYVADWVAGWDPSDVGRVIRVIDPVANAQPIVAETKEILAGTSSERSAEELERLLLHPNQKVRLEAQWELAERTATDVLARAAEGASDVRGRFHGLWGLGQIARRDVQVLDTVLAHATDTDAEVRAQTFRVLADHAWPKARDAATAALSDSDPHVQYFAAMTLGRIGDKDSFDLLVDWVARTGTDRFRRHAAVVAWTRFASTSSLTRLADHPSRDVRLAAIVALRRLQSPRVQRFLEDRDVYVAIEAARAIHDAPIEEARPALAELSDTDWDHPWLLRRALTSAFRLGRVDDAERLADFAADDRRSLEMRREAVAMLADWKTPSPRDRVLGRLYPFDPAERPIEAAAAALQHRLPELLAAGGELQKDAVQAAKQLGVIIDPATLFETVLAEDRLAETRIAALDLLADQDAERFEEAFAAALHARAPELRAAAHRRWLDSAPEEAVASLSEWLESASWQEQQLAFGVLRDRPIPEARETLERWKVRLLAGEVAPEARLDLVEALEASGGVLAGVPTNGETPVDPELVDYRFALHGGDAERGRRLFHFKVETECLRCHQAGGEGGERGGNVAPSLAGLGERQSRPEILESILLPNRKIAEGFESVLCITEDGLYHTGRVIEETDTELVIEPVDAPLGPNGRPVPLRLSKDEIEERAPALSPMPANFRDFLSPREMRDLIEFLSSQ
ncbi:MAG: HEAT repeat domain-containing protein [Planctomycetota bacterium]